MKSSTPASEETPLMDDEVPKFMGDISGHKGVGRYMVPLDSLKGENSTKGTPALASKMTYDANLTLQNLRRWEGTVLPGLIRRPLIWLSFVIYFSAAICNRGFEEQCGQHLPKILLKEISTMGGLLTFFLAFYAMSCYSRFMSQYTHLKDIEGMMRSIAIQVRMFYLLPCKEHSKKEGDLAKFWSVELLRNLGACYYLVFARLYDGTMWKFNLQTAHQEGLLTSEEVEDLKDETPSMCWFRVLCWSFEIVTDMGESHEPINGETVGIKGMLPGHVAKLQQSILNMREAINAVTYESQMPVPLPYYHIITIIVFGFILTYSYACAFITTSPALAWIVWIVPVFGFAGMREVAIAMADPFGDDDVDLPVDVYVHNIMHFLAEFLTKKTRPTAVDGLSFFKNIHWAEKHTTGSDKQQMQLDLHHGSHQEKTSLEKSGEKKAWKIFADRSTPQKATTDDAHLGQMEAMQLGYCDEFD